MQRLKRFMEARGDLAYSSLLAAYNEAGEFRCYLLECGPVGRPRWVMSADPKGLCGWIPAYNNAGSNTGYGSLNSLFVRPLYNGLGAAPNIKVPCDKCGCLPPEDS